LNFDDSFRNLAIEKFNELIQYYKNKPTEDT